MGKLENELVEAGMILAALWFGTEIIKSLSNKCPTCGQQFQGRPSQCPNCGTILGWKP